jgi:glycosyltransferase involved in cell wall biosynthesis
VPDGAAETVAHPAAGDERHGRHHICFISGTRYSDPLTPTQSKKFQGLARHNQVSVVAFSADAWPRRFEQYGRFYLLPAIRIRHVRYALLFLVAPVLALWCVAWRGADVIVAQSPYEGCVGAWVKHMARRLFRRRVALIVESHGDFERDPFLQRRSGGTGMYTPAMRVTARAALRNADAFRAISTSTRDQIRHLGGTQPLVQIPTWSDIDLFLEAGRRRTTLGRDVLYAGVLIPRKGVHHLIAAFAKAERPSDTRLILVGDSPDARYRRELDRQVRDHRLGNSVVFTPALAPAVLAERMSIARMLVLPSLSEGLGRVVFEAMAAGAPVIGSNVGGIPDLIQDGLNGFLVTPGDEEQLADRMTVLLLDADMNARMGAAAREFAATRLSAERYFAEYQRLFDLAAGWALTGAARGN